MPKPILSPFLDKLPLRMGSMLLLVLQNLKKSGGEMSSP